MKMLVVFESDSEEDLQSAIEGLSRYIYDFGLPDHGFNIPEADGTGSIGRLYHIDKLTPLEQEEFRFKEDEA